MILSVGHFLKMTVCQEVQHLVVVRERLQCYFALSENITLLAFAVHVCCLGNKRTINPFSPNNCINN